MLYSEFSRGINREHSEGTLYAYNTINDIYMSDNDMTKEDCYSYFNSFADEFMWIDKPQIGRDKYLLKPDELIETISEERAKDIIAGEFGFDKSKIEIVHIPYFECWDYNYILFIVCDLAYCMANSDLYQVWR